MNILNFVGCHFCKIPLLESIKIFYFYHYNAGALLVLIVLLNTEEWTLYFLRRLKQVKNILKTGYKNCF